MNCSVFTRPGHYHKINALSCEDYYAIIEKDDLRILVLCDGAGNTKSGADAARLVSHTVAEYLYENFYKLFYLDSSDVKRRIAQKIDNHLKEYSVEAGIEEKGLACTIMAVAIDKDQRCICLHLGDGVVLHYKDDQAAPKVISSPMNGLSENLTFVTMNCDLNQYLQFYRWKENEAGTFLLMTDGAQEYFVQAQEEILGKRVTEDSWDIEELQFFLDKCNPVDDYSCGVIRY